jgi:hypothetical protein
MEPLIITEIESCPNIILDKENNKFEMSGNSLPEDVHTFYDPVFRWIEEYIKQPNVKTELSIKLIYFNSASVKAVLDILTLFEELIVKGFEMKVIWYFLEIDEDMLATGEELASVLKIPFEFVACNDEWVRLMNDDA